MIPPHAAPRRFTLSALIARAVCALVFGLILGPPASGDTPVYQTFRIDPCLAAGGGTVIQQDGGSTLFTTQPSFSVSLTTTTPSGSPTGLNGTCASLPGPTPNSAAIQALWKLNGSGADSSSSGNTLSFVPSATFVANTPIVRNVAQSFSPNSTPSYGQTASAIALGNTSFTIETWYRWLGNSGTGYSSLFLDCETVATDKCLYVVVDDSSGGQLQFGFDGDDIHSSVAINDGVWHHLAFVFSGTTKNIYIDGVLRNGATTGTQAAFTGAPTVAYIGGWPGFGYYANGYINSMAVYRRAFGASEVQAHAKGQLFKIQNDGALDGNLSGQYCTAPVGVGANNWQWGFGANRTIPTGSVAFEFDSLGADGTFAGGTASVTVDQTNMGSPPSPITSAVGLTNATWTLPQWYCDSHATNPNTNVHYTVNRDWTSVLGNYASRVYTDVGLNPNTTYGVDFQATYVDNAPGNGASVGPSPRVLAGFATTLAQVPTQPTITITGPRSATLSAGLGSAPSNPAHTAIDMEGSTNGPGGPYLQLSGFQFFDVTPNRAVSNLAASSKYYFQSKAVNLNNVQTVGSGSNGTFMVTQPSTPANLTGAPAQGPGLCPKTQIQWSWSPVTMGSGVAPQYNLTRDVGTPVSGLIGSNSYIESGLTPATAYGAMVRAFDSGANAAAPDIRYSLNSSTGSTSTTSLPIETPRAPVASLPTLTSITWTWPPVVNACSPTYTLYNAQTGGVILAGIVGNTVTLAGLTSNAISAVQVDAFDAYAPGGSGLSPSATAYTLANVPTALAPSAVTTNAITLGWTSLNPGYTRFEVTYSPDNFTVTTSTRVTVANNFTATTISLTGLTAATNYSVRVRAFNGQGPDPFGAVPTVFATASIVTAPAAPTLSGATLSNSQIQWTWSPTTVPSGFTPGYTLYDTPTQTVIYSGLLTTFTSAALSVNTAYVAEVEEYVQSSPTTISARGQASAYTLANAPTATTVAAVFATSATFSWNPNGNPAYTFYQVIVATDPAFGIVTATLTVTSPSATATGLLPGVIYYSRVQAINGGQVAAPPFAYVAIPQTMTAPDPEITVSSTPASPYVASPGLVLVWQFDENTGTTTLDATGLGNTGNFGCVTSACVSTPTFTAGPVGLGSAASFSGLAGGRVLTTNDINIPGSVTVEAWVNPVTSAQTANAGIVGVGAKNAEDFAIDVSAAGAFEFLTSNGGVEIPVTVATATIKAGQWTHVVGVYDLAHASATLYLNGVPVAVQLGMPARPNTVLPLAVGNRKDAAGNVTLPFAGAIDSVRVFNVALTPAQVLADFQGGFVSSVTPSAPNNGVIVALPPNAFGAPAQIFISADPVNHPIRITPAALNAGLAVTPFGLTLVPGSLVEVVPVVGGLPFTTPLGSSATLTIPYKDPSSSGLISNTNPPLTAAGIRMYTLNTAVNSWEYLPTTVDKVNHAATGVTPHFSVFALFAPSTVGSNLSGVKAFPVPWKPGSGGRFDAPGVTFSNLPVSGTIRILTLAGRRVRDFTFNGVSAGNAVWDGLNDDGRRAASGVYFARVSSGVDGSTVLVKFAIER